MPDQSPDFRKCIERGGLSRVDGDPQIVAKEILVARQDLSEAEASIKRGSFKWATVQAYYAMFHIARALVYQSGYREKSHRCLAIALRELYVQPKVGHYGVFNGRRFREEIYPRVRDFILANDQL